MSSLHKQSTRFKEVLSDLKGKPVAVVGHMRPDGDCIGSQIAMVRLLNDLGADAIGVNAHAVPKNLKFLVADTPFTLASRYQPKEGTVAVAVDCADDRRMGKELAALFPKFHVNVDHHLSNPQYAEHNFICEEASAACELIAGYLIDLDMPIDPVTAQALYVGIATDTGQFCHNSTNDIVFKVVAKLCEKGANPAEASRNLYEEQPMSKVALLQRFLNTLKLECAGKVCTGVLTQKDYKETGASSEHSEGLVDYTRAIAGVEVGLFLEEYVRGGVKVSLRAKNPKLRLDKFAGKFNGGGHACAAGINTEDSLDTFYPKLIETLDDYLKELDI